MRNAEASFNAGTLLSLCEGWFPMHDEPSLLSSSPIFQMQWTWTFIGNDFWLSRLICPTNVNQAVHSRVAPSDRWTVIAFERLAMRNAMIIRGAVQCSAVGTSLKLFKTIYSGLQVNRRSSYTGNDFWLSSLICTTKCESGCAVKRRSQCNINCHRIDSSARNAVGTSLDPVYK